MTNRLRNFRYALVYLAFLLPSLIFRVLCMQKSRILYPADDVRGFLSDFLVAGFLFVLALIPMGAIRIAVVTLLAFLNVAIGYGNYEHIRVLGDSADVRFLAYLVNPTFFKGSVLSPAQHLVLRNLPLSSAFFSALCLLIFARFWSLPRWGWRRIGLLVVILLGVSLVPYDRRLVRRWRGSNIVQMSVRNPL